VQTIITALKETLARAFKPETEEERLERLTQTYEGHRGGAAEQRHIELQYRSSGCGE